MAASGEPQAEHQRGVSQRPPWAVGALSWQWRQTEPLAYHQLLRGVPRFRWWKPVVALLLGLGYFFFLSTVFSMLVLGLFLMLSEDSPTVEGALQLLAVPDTQQPLSLLLTLGTIALMMPAAYLAMLSVGLSPVGRLSSVALAWRWRWLGRSVVPAFVSLGCVTVLGAAVGLLGDAVFGSAEGVDPVGAPSQTLSVTAGLWSVLFILLLVPLQATAEELIFRGALMQAIGSLRARDWVRVLLVVGIPLVVLVLLVIVVVEPFLAALQRFAGDVSEANTSSLADSAGIAWGAADVGVLLLAAAAAAALLRWRTGSPFFVVFVPSVLFSMLHIYELWGLLTVAAMALSFAWLTWRTGGLEMAVTYHVVNNVVVFLLMTAAVDGQTAQSAEGGSPLSFVVSVLGMLLFAWWMNRDFRRHDGRATRVDVVQELAPSMSPGAALRQPESSMPLPAPHDRD